MTLGDAKRKVFMLLDEYSSGGEVTEDEDIALKMADFFDMAQKDIIQYQPIVRRASVTLDGTGRQQLPADVARVTRIAANGVRTSRYEIVDGELLYTAGDMSDLVLDYEAEPQRITPETSDNYEFEVSENAANCLPFFVAGQQVFADLVQDYAVYYNTYLQMRAALPRTVSSTGDGRIRQNLFRRS